MQVMSLIICPKAKIAKMYEITYRLERWPFEHLPVKCNSKHCRTYDAGQIHGSKLGRAGNVLSSD
jgi:hypothetical protein